MFGIGKNLCRIRYIWKVSLSNGCNDDLVDDLAFETLFHTNHMNMDVRLYAFFHEWANCKILWIGGYKIYKQIVSLALTMKYLEVILNQV